MARAGEELVNPATGQRLRFVRTAADTGGEVLEVESTYQAGGPRPPQHYHPAQQERYEVVDGDISVLLDGRLVRLRAGDQLVIPVGAKHAVWSEGGGRIRWLITPALRTEQFFETVYGLAAAGKVNDKGVPDLPRSAVIAKDFAAEFRPATPPWPVLRVVTTVLAPLGRMRA
jgi:quercetin dioxygenase-like cupin family protein